MSPSVSLISTFYYRKPFTLPTKLVRPEKYEDGHYSATLSLDNMPWASTKTRQYLLNNRVIQAFSSLARGNQEILKEPAVQEPAQRFGVSPQVIFTFRRLSFNPSEKADYILLQEGYFKEDSQSRLHKNADLKHVETAANMMLIQPFVMLAHVSHGTFFYQHTMTIFQTEYTQSQGNFTAFSLPTPQAS